MAFRSRLAALAAGAVALPAAALLAAPAMAAQAQPTCSSMQVQVTFADGSSTCQSLGLQIYGGSPAGPITKICAGAGAMAVPVILGQTELLPVNSGSCTTYSQSSVELPDAIIVLPGLPGLPAL